MAVENKVITQNATSAAAYLGEASLFTGQVKKRVSFSFEVAAADDDGSIYGIAEIPVNAKDVVVTQMNDGITSGTDYDTGYYQVAVSNGGVKTAGTVVDKACIADGTDNSSARTTSPLITTPLVANIGKKAWEIAGLSAQPTYPTFLLALTANTVGSAAGTIGGFVDYTEL